MMPCGIRLDLFPFVSFILLWLKFSLFFFFLFFCLTFFISACSYFFFVVALFVRFMFICTPLISGMEVKTNDMIFVNANTHLREHFVPWRTFSNTVQSELMANHYVNPLNRFNRNFTLYLSENTHRPLSI